MEERRLAALMFTDMVGYSALVQNNEAEALTLLEEHKQILRSLFPSFHGREIKTIGDAFLAEFPSALEAAQCAIAIQKSLHKRNEGGGKPVRIRIGLHVGDVVYKENDVFGDGVNIAARIEPLAEPGGICCSEDVARQIQNKLDVPLRKLGKTELKNIDLPTELYSFVLPWSTASARRSTPRKTTTVALLAGLAVVILAIGYVAWRSPFAPAKYSPERIAVLPFENISPDPNDEYFADGVTEELITTLSNIGSFSVIARTSVAKYKNLTKGASEIGKELMVGTIIEGSVRKAVDKARITVKLIDAASQRLIWSKDYDEQIKDLFMVQSDIATKVAGELKIQLAAAEAAQIAKRGSESLEATQNNYLGRYFLNQRTAETIQKSIGFFERAIDADPNFAHPYAGLAEAYTLIGGSGYGFLPHDEAIRRAESNALKALKLDDQLAEAHNSLAYVRFRLQWDWESAEKEFKRAISLQPSYAKAHEWYALYLALLGRSDEAIPEMRRALELDPLSSSVGTGLGRLLAFNRQYEESVDQIKKTLALDSTYAEGHFALGLTYGYMKKYDRSIEHLKRAVELSGERHVIIADLGYIYAKMGRRDEALAMLHRLDELAGKEHVSPFEYCLLYMGLGEKEKGFEYLEQGYKDRDGLMVYLKVDPVGDEFRGDPRFTVLLKKIGLDQ